MITFQCGLSVILLNMVTVEGLHGDSGVCVCAQHSCQFSSSVLWQQEISRFPFKPCDLRLTIFYACTHTHTYIYMHTHTLSIRIYNHLSNLTALHFTNKWVTERRDGLINPSHTHSCLGGWRNKHFISPGQHTGRFIWCKKEWVCPRWGWTEIRWLYHWHTSALFHWFWRKRRRSLVFFSIKLHLYDYWHSVLLMHYRSIYDLK